MCYLPSLYSIQFFLPSLASTHPCALLPSVCTLFALLKAWFSPYPCIVTHYNLFASSPAHTHVFLLWKPVHMLCVRKECTYGYMQKDMGQSGEESPLMFSPYKMLHCWHVECGCILQIKHISSGFQFRWGGLKRCDPPPAVIVIHFAHFIFTSFCFTCRLWPGSLMEGSKVVEWSALLQTLQVEEHTLEFPVFYYLGPVFYHLCSVLKPATASS